MKHFTLQPGQLSYHDIVSLSKNDTTLKLNPSATKAIKASQNIVSDIIKNQQTVYGINTGFGLLAHTKIPSDKLEELQRRIVLSHAAGTGNYLSDEIVRLVILFKINSLARGFSGIRFELIEALIQLFNHQVYPCIPEKGSVGASGDLAPLAHLSLVLIGEGSARHQGKIITGKAALKIAALKPLTLQAKEGLALLNGTQVSSAMAFHALIQTEQLLTAGLIAGALCVDGALGSRAPFDARIHEVRGHQAQMDVARILRELLQESEIQQSHATCDRVQDPYSLRCQPQVLGACLTHLRHIKQTLCIEVNGVTDNPLVFPDNHDILSGGNFHAEPVAIAADLMAICIAEIGAIAERRIALLIDPHHNNELPAFLVEEPGINSGFMLAHVTATALASENKSLAHPASVDSMPTSANQEDHVSMAAFAARRLTVMAENTATIIAIELLTATQALDLRRPLKTSDTLDKYAKQLRKTVPTYKEDRFFAPDIEQAKQLIQTFDTFSLFEETPCQK
jgi:histidine ammonia-lyase